MLLFVSSSPLPDAPSPGEAVSVRIHELLPLLSRLKHGSVSWAISQHAVTGLTESAQQGLKRRVDHEGDDIVLQGLYGIPHAVLTDRELQLETHVERRSAARALNVSEESLQRRIAPLEPDIRRLEETSNSDGAIIGTTGSGRHCRLWTITNGAYTSVPAVDLSRTNAERWLLRLEARGRLNRNSLACLIVDAQSPEALRRFEALAPTLTASTVGFPQGEANPPRAPGPPAAPPAAPPAGPTASPPTPIVTLRRTPLWHAQLIALARTRPRTPRGRATKRALTPFGATPEELEREHSGNGEFYERRVFHASMLGSARMSEGDMTVFFSDGSFIGLTRGEESQTRARPYTGMVREQGRRAAFRVAGAFSFDWDTARGLATQAVAGGITLRADYLLLNGVSWLIVRARMDYREGRASTGSGATVRPLPLPIGRVTGDASVSAQLRRHDGGRQTTALPHSGRHTVTPLAGEHIALHFESSCVELAFIDEGQGITWEAAVEMAPRARGHDIYLLPFGQFTQIPAGVSATSIVFAIRDCDSPSTPDELAELKRRVLAVLPSPSTETVATHEGATTSSPA